ncbi:antirestriction protein ArdA [Synechococcus sp. HK01-R]|uniref:antirestriction protein ArdA n=1 Tax=Synechococcus sp. HK01-R TaxID=2751171 RepID=UPI00162770B0|nr:antirestriction protein ArdA [Synechococcus sp. HK01-R]QNG26076.1 antirestriction protein ArdA [Synechococcus sp. HK01-R]
MTATTTKKPACIFPEMPYTGVYIACLASYNAGRLHGAWVDLEQCQDEGDIQAAIDWILATSPEPGAEEWAMHDSSNLPGYLSRNEWPALSDLIEWAHVACSLGSPEEDEAYRLACENQGKTLDKDQFWETYCDCYSSEEDYAYKQAIRTGALPDELPWPLSHIDWAGAWRELASDGYHAEPCSSGGVHIFCSR